MSEMPPGLAAELETLQRKHAQYPEGRYFVPLANARRKAGDLHKAETLLREGMEIHPEYLSAYIVLGRCLEDRGDAAEAEEQFRRVLSRDPQNLVALQHLGEIAARDGRREDAARWYHELIGADPMNDGARARLAELEAEEPEAVSSETPEEDQRWEGEGGLAREVRDDEELGAGEDAGELSDRLPAELDPEEPLIGAADRDGSPTDEAEARVPSSADDAGEVEDEVHAGVEEPEEGDSEVELGNGGPSDEDRDDEAPFEPVGREEEPGPAETDREASWGAPLEVEDDAGEAEDESHARVEGPEERELEVELGNGGPSDEDRDDEARFEPVGREEEPGPAETDREASWGAPLEVEYDASEAKDEVHTGVEGPEERDSEEELGNGGPSEEDRVDEAPFEPVGREEEPGPAETDREAPWGAPLEVEDDAVGMGPADSDSTLHDDDEVEVGVVTETIATIYARQGLYDRAAAVYRKLLKERGDEPHLRERLAEVERAMADQDRPESEASSAESEESDASYAPVEEFSGDEGGAGRDEGRYAVADYSPSAPTPAEERGVTPPEESDADLWASEEPETELAEEAGYVGAEDFAPAVVGGGDRDAEREPTGEEDSAESLPIGSYLRRLLAWTPPPHPEEDGAEESADEGGQDSAGPTRPAGAESGYAEAGVEAEEGATGDATAMEGAPDSFTTEDLVEGLPDPASESAQEDVDPEGEVPSDEEELWLAPPPEEETGREPSGSHTPEGGHSVETFAERSDTGLEEVVSPSEGEAVGEEPEGAGSGPGEETKKETKEETKEETDDDLQSFQAWLKSLKR